jgi:hypothetical protein
MVCYETPSTVRYCLCLGKLDPLKKPVSYRQLSQQCCLPVLYVGNPLSRERQCLCLVTLSVTQSITLCWHLKTIGNG